MTIKNNKNNDNKKDKDNSNSDNHISFSMRIDKELHKEFKLYCIDNNTKMGEEILNMIKERIKIKDKIKGKE